MFSGDKYLKHIEDIVKAVEAAAKKSPPPMNWKRRFDLLGITRRLEDMYITKKDLENNETSKKYIKIIENKIEEFIRDPAYSDIDLNSPQSLEYLDKDINFQDFLEALIDEMQEKLGPRFSNVQKYLNKYPKKSEINLDNMLSTVKLDKVSALLILDDLYDRGEIYDYNGREITLK